jgi:hypothetical protein
MLEKGLWFSCILSCTQIVEELSGDIIAVAQQMQHKARQSFSSGMQILDVIAA